MVERLTRPFQRFVQIETAAGAVLITATLVALLPVELSLGRRVAVGFAIMPLFAWANAGMPISRNEFGSPVALAVFAGFVVGKPVGVLALSWVAVRSGIAIRPADLTWILVTEGGCSRHSPGSDPDA